MGRRRVVDPTSLILVAVATAALLIAFGVWIFSLRGGEHAGAHTVAQPSRQAARASGCVLTTSPYGYPASFITQQLPYKRHPPLPQPGWHGESDPLAFRVLFHSLFHGYAVVQYLPGLPQGSRTLLENWVEMHAGDRVTATPAPASAPFVVDVAEWGHELRCRTADTLTAPMLDRFIGLRG